MRNEQPAAAKTFSTGGGGDNLIAAQAWDEGALAGTQYGLMPTQYPYPKNPYRSA